MSKPQASPLYGQAKEIIEKLQVNKPVVFEPEHVENFRKYLRQIALRLEVSIFTKVKDGKVTIVRLPN